jgi:hypothetical protein
MKPSFIEDQEALGRRFEAINEAERGLAVAFAERRRWPVPTSG